MLHWTVELVADDEISEEWYIVDIDGQLTVLCRESALDADPGRITTEVVAALRCWRARACSPSLALISQN